MTPTPHRLERMAAVAARRTRFATLLLDGVHDPHNVAAVLRSADAFGIQEVHVVESPERLRIANSVARGAAHWIDLFRYPDAEVALDLLQQRGYAAWAAAGAATVDLMAWDAAQPTVFVLGNEHRGVGGAILERADVAFAIPMVGMVESLNVSVACALTLHHARRRLDVSDHNYRLNTQEQAELIDRWRRRGGAQATA